MLKRTTASLIGIFVLIFSLMGFSTAKAADSSRSITITPPSFELYANPGDTVTEKLRVRNDSGADSTFQILVEDFKAVGEDGSVDLIDDQSNTTYSLAKWVFPEPKSFSIPSGGEKEIPFTISVPKDAEPGGHYASVLVSMGGGQVNSGASVTSRVGSLILLRVSGNAKEEANAESFSSSKGYYRSGPVDFELRVKNSGNNHIRPKGTIVITNIFGQKVAEVPLNGLNVLPGAIRKMTSQWKPSGFIANRYTATLVATYGQDNKPLSVSTSFTIFPKYLIVVVLIVLVIIALLVVGRKRIKRILHNLTK